MYRRFRHGLFDRVWLNLISVAYSLRISTGWRHSSRGICETIAYEINLDASWEGARWETMRL